MEKNTVQRLLMISEHVLSIKHDAVECTAVKGFSWKNCSLIYVFKILWKIVRRWLLLKKNVFSRTQLATMTCFAITSRDI